MSRKTLDEKIAVVTGGASNIGKATAILMGKEGAHVIIADINLEGAQKVADEINHMGGNAVVKYLDIGKPETIESVMSFAREKYGKLDVLFNNAAVKGIAGDNNVRDMDIDGWDNTFKLNLRSIMLGCKYAIPHMIAGGGGSIINTASVAALCGGVESSAYAASKAAILSLTRDVATQYGRDFIRCNAVAPGSTYTQEAIDNFSDSRREMLNILISGNVLSQVVSPEDVAELVVFLASDKAKCITGTVIPIDNGYSMHNPVAKQIQAYLDK